MKAKELVAALEGILYITGDEGVTDKELSELLDLKLKKVNELIEFFKKYLDDDQSRGLRLVEFNGRFKLATKPEQKEYYSKLVESTIKKNRLSQAALETLAIIAYKGPITRTEVEDVRGVNADSMVKKLEAMALIKEVGRTEDPGRPILYNITDEFFDHFGISSKDELPDLPELVAQGDDEDLFETNRLDKKVAEDV